MPSERLRSTGSQTIEACLPHCTMGPTSDRTKGPEEIEVHRKERKKRLQKTKDWTQGAGTRTNPYFLGRQHSSFCLNSGTRQFGSRSIVFRRGHKTDVGVPPFFFLLSPILGLPAPAQSPEGTGMYGIMANGSSPIEPDVRCACPVPMRSRTKLRLAVRQ